ncbi:MAG: MMPL family transporter [Bacteroidales bacterium]|nr:MMPL family transporter [Bacteroidales bacterium]
MSRFLVRYRNWLLLATAVLTLVCGICFPLVNVNSDMTKYLPRKSPMRAGVEIIANEIGESMTAGGADMRLMYEGLDSLAGEAVSRQLSSYPQIDGVSVSERDGYTLYELSVPQSVDQKKLGKKIVKDSPAEVIVETGQDGATPDFIVLVLAGLLLLVILIIMCQSWLEPVLLLASTGMAILINMGSNALLPSVSITTNSIVAILQLVLSIDYSIILMNRYRQERSGGTAPEEAMIFAVANSRKSIFSSALTTIVGLLVLVFMNIRIGLDMGLVLSKGVVCSLITNVTALPALIVFFDGAIRKSQKKTPTIPTGRMTVISVKYKIPLAIAFILIFGLTYYFHEQTEISFSTKGESLIDKVFPRNNTNVIVYSNSDSLAVIDLADSISALKSVENVISYPSIMLAERTAGDMAGRLGELAPDAPVSPDMLRVLYYAANNDGSLKLRLKDISKFLSKACEDTASMIHGYITPEFRSQIDLLAMVVSSPVEKPVFYDIIVEEPAPAVEPEPVTEPQAEPEPVQQESTVYETVEEKKQVEKMKIGDFMTILASKKPSEETAILLPLTDTLKIRKARDKEGMSAFIGSTSFQTNFVYKLSDAGTKGTMTALEYVHFLADDLFNRKALASMVTAEQKKGLTQRMEFMDLANKGTLLTPAKISSMLTGFGVKGMNEAAVKAMFPYEGVTITREVKKSVTSTPSSKVSGSSTAKSETVIESEDGIRRVERGARTQEEREQVLLYNMVGAGRRYTAAEMGRNIKTLGASIDPAMMELLYTCYGAENNYDENWKMSLSGIVDFVNDNFASSGIEVEGFDADALSALNQIDQVRGDSHSLLVVESSLPDESPATYDFIDRVKALCGDKLGGDHYLVGESAMLSEMKAGFKAEMRRITWLTVIAIFIIVALTFKSLMVPLILVLTIMTGVFVNVAVSGAGDRTLLYLAYLIVQSILMGATIDYGILFTNNYREKRRRLGIALSVRGAYRTSINTILTSGLIMVLAPGLMALMVDDMTIAAIVGNLSVGAFAAVTMVLFVLPGLLAAFDRFVVPKKYRKKD